RCILCQYCYFACPRIDYPTVDKQIDAKVFPADVGRDRKYAPEIGNYLECYSIRSRKNEFLEKATDGGVVSTFLAYALQEGFIDCGVATTLSKDKPWLGVPKVALTKSELLETVGTSYNISPMHEGLREAAEEFDKHKIGFVGLPCQVIPVRKMQDTDYGYLIYGNRVSLTIGLFCAGAFYYDGFVDGYLAKEKGIDPKKISKMDIKHNHFLVEAQGQRVLDVPLKEINQYKRDNCHACPYGFSADVADISVGAVGSLEGWTTVLVRTEIGRKVVEGAASAGFIEVKPLEEQGGLSEVARLEAIKKKRFEKWTQAHPAPQFEPVGLAFGAYQQSKTASQQTAKPSTATAPAQSPSSEKQTAGQPKSQTTQSKDSHKT
ncbi:MAG: Coenzyme F420 hydrogenase/dehydrogenase, beta subunit C-terminal domain, partial [Candidatus Bathyarchaeia archaeon]